MDFTPEVRARLEAQEAAREKTREQGMLRRSAERWARNRRGTDLLAERERWEGMGAMAGGAAW